MEADPKAPTRSLRLILVSNSGLIAASKVGHTSAMLRTWAVRLPAIWFTDSVRSFHTLEHPSIGLVFQHRFSHLAHLSHPQNQTFC